MTSDEILEAELTAEINAHNAAYYVRGRATITDADYDSLVRLLQEVEARLGRAKPGSPTQRVGSDLDGSFAKTRHSSPMLSLENAFSASEVQAFFGEEANDAAVVEAKVDGLALELRYRGGLLTQAVTRGTGSEGDDVTANVRSIRAIPLLIDAVDLDVRGEVYMRRSVFARLNSERAAAGDEAFANPRNAAAGSLKLKSPAEVARRGLSFVAYWATLPQDFTQQEATAELHRMGFPTLLSAPLKPTEQEISESAEDADFPEATTPLIFGCQLGDEADLSSAIENIRVQRDDVDLDTDGAVVKINSRARQSELGNKSKAPRWACAFKFPPERKATELLGVEITVGRTGQVTPNARLSPVHLSGTTVENASLMNADELERIGSPAVGDIVWVEKSAEIIPRVVGVKERRQKSQPWQFPGGCVSCGCSLSRQGVHWFCLNLQCEERVYQRLKHATSKGALDWDGMGEAQVRHIVSVLGPALHPEPIRLSAIFTADPASLGLKSAAKAKFLSERERVKGAPLWRKLACLGVEDLGQTLSRELAARYGSLDAIITALEEAHLAAAKAEKAAPPTEILAMMGPVAHNKLVEYLKAEIQDLMLLESAGFVFSDPDFGAADRPLSGKTFVITGTLSDGRDKVEARIMAAGGMVKSSVGKKVTHLVVGETPGASKLADAKKYGTTLLDEAALYEMLGEPIATAERNLDDI